MDIIFSIICGIGLLYIYRFVSLYKSVMNLEVALNKQVFLLNERVDNLYSHFRSVEESGRDNFNIVTDVLHTHELMIDKLEQEIYNIHNPENE